MKPKMSQSNDGSDVVPPDKKKLRWILVKRIALMLWLFTIAYGVYRADKFPDQDNCYYHFAIHDYALNGVLYLVDTTVDKSGVGFFVYNSSKEETYNLWSNQLLSLYRKGILRLGDSISKVSRTRLGRVKTSVALIDSVELLKYSRICDEYTQYRRNEVMRQYPVSFKR